MSDLSMLSAEGSRARTSASPVEASALPVDDLACGSISPGSSENYSPDSRSLKTPPSFALEDWKKFSGASMRSGTMRSGTVSPLPMLARLTVVTECGFSLTGKKTHSVPTPTASDYIRRTCTSIEMLNFATNKSVSLDRWLDGVPSPTFSEWLMGLPLNWTSPD